MSTLHLQMGRETLLTVEPWVRVFLLFYCICRPPGNRTVALVHIGRGLQILLGENYNAGLGWSQTPIQKSQRQFDRIQQITSLRSKTIIRTRRVDCPFHTAIPAARQSKPILHQLYRISFLWALLTCRLQSTNVIVYYSRSWRSVRHANTRPYLG